MGDEAREDSELDVRDDEAAEIDLRALCEQQAFEMLEVDAANKALRDTLTMLEYEVAQYAALFRGQLEKQKESLPEPALQLLNGLSPSRQLALLSGDADSPSVDIVIKGVPPSPRANHSGSDGQQRQQPANGPLKGW